jgi:hypothetical protein
MPVTSAQPDRYGWECPRCHRVWNPSVIACHHCPVPEQPAFIAKGDDPGPAGSGRDRPVSGMYGWVDEVASWTAAESQSTAAADQDSSLAAMIGTVAEGDRTTDLDRALLRLKLVRAAQDKGLSWASIGAALGYPSGRQAKKAVHGLEARVRRELMLSRRNDLADLLARRDDRPGYRQEWKP